MVVVVVVVVAVVVAVVVETPVDVDADDDDAAGDCARGSGTKSEPGGGPPSSWAKTEYNELLSISLTMKTRFRKTHLLAVVVMVGFDSSSVDVIETARRDDLENTSSSTIVAGLGCWISLVIQDVEVGSGIVLAAGTGSDGTINTPCCLVATAAGN